jgi:hypothetical protein
VDDADRATLKSIAESLADLRQSSQIIKGAFLHNLDRLSAIETTLRRIDGAIAGGHASKEREPMVEADVEEPETVTAAEIERALEGEKT